MLENIDWNTTITSVTTSGVVAIIVAWYFRFKAKPKSEIVYDYNRNANFTLLFDNIEIFDWTFETFYTIYEQRLGLLTREREEILPRIAFTSSGSGNQVIPPVNFRAYQGLTNELASVKQDLAEDVARMREYHRNFLKDYHLFQNYFHDKFLRDIHMYYFSSIHYSEWLLQ
ncbi:MAG: hypothetical protein ACRD9Q_00775, partial [Nitrososphaeraceae archaeon]